MKIRRPKTRLGRALRAPGGPRQVGINLCLTILAGVVVSGWVLGYTDLFPQVASLLSLGGLFAWIAFVSQIVTPDTKKRLQEGLEAHVLSRQYFGMGVLVVLSLFGVWASRRGSLVVGTFHDTRDRTLEIRALDSQGLWSRVIVAEEALPAHTEQQWSLPAPFWGSRNYRVKVSGLPVRVFPVMALGHRQLAVPFSFAFADHPVLLLHAAAAMVSTAESGLSTLVVRAADGRELGRISPYRGESVWVGCDADVDIPDDIMARWRLELVLAGAAPERMVRWLMRQSIAPELALTRTPRISPLTIELITALPPIRLQVPVSPPYPQEVTLDVPHRSG